jgi:hypothetical protein
VTHERRESRRPSAIVGSQSVVAPKVEDFPEFVERMGRAIRTPYDWSGQQEHYLFISSAVFTTADIPYPETEADKFVGRCRS